MSRRRPSSDDGFVADGFEPEAPAAAEGDGFTAEAPAKPKTTGENIRAALGMLGRTIDYPGSLRRGAAGLATGTLSWEDFKKGATPFSGVGIPDSAELLARGGIGKGGSLSDLLPSLYEEPPAGTDALRSMQGQWFSKPDKGGWLDPTARGAAGFALDVAADPLTYIPGTPQAKALKEINTARKAALPPAKKAAGKGVQEILRPAVVRERRAAEQMLRDAERQVTHQAEQHAATQEIAHPPRWDAELPTPHTGGGLPVVLPEEAATHAADEAMIVADLAEAGLEAPTHVASAPRPGVARWAAQGIGRAATYPFFPARMLEDSGTSLYRRGLKPAVDFGKDRGKDVVDVFSRHGVGSLNAMENIQSLADKLKGARDQLLVDAGKGGRRVSRVHSFNPTLERLMELRETNRLTPREARKIGEDLIGRYLPGNEPSPLLASQWKTDLRKSLPGQSWNELRQTNGPLAEELRKGAAKGLQEEIEITTEKSLGKGGELNRLNSDLGTVLTVKPQTIRRARSARDQKLLDPIDWLLMTGEIPVGMYSGAAAGGMSGLFGLKKAVNMLSMPKFQVPLGYGMKAAGESKSFAPLYNALIRRQIAKPVRNPHEEN